jgi:RES domain-containing protein
VLAWRLCRAPYADLSGDGARRYGGRWNGPGRPLLYTASTAALAVLEVRVHLDLPPDLLPDDYVLITIDLGQASIEIIDTLPASPQDVGDRWLQEARTAILQVPSTIVPESANLLINPAHPGASTIAILNQRPFTFDTRLWHPGAQK